MRERQAERLRRELEGIEVEADYTRGSRRGERHSGERHSGERELYVPGGGGKGGKGGEKRDARQAGRATKERDAREREEREKEEGKWRGLREREALDKDLPRRGLPPPKKPVRQLEPRADLGAAGHIG
mgnify:CR=1 FL=1